MGKRLLSVLVLLASCTADVAPEYDLASDPSLDGYLEQRRLRMNLTVSISGSSATVTVRELSANGAMPDCLQGSDAGNLVNTIGSPIISAPTAVVPLSPIGAADAPPNFATPSGCDGVMLQAQTAICTAHRLLEVIASPGETTWDGRKNDGTGAAGTWVVGAQDEESNTALAEEAIHWARRAMVLAGENLRKGISASNADPLLSPCGAGDMATLFGDSNKLPDRQDYANHLVMFLAEGAGLVEEATRRAHQGHLAVADADFSRAPDNVTASQASWLDKNISRARAAHLVMGGPLTDGLRDFKREDQAGGMISEIASVCALGELSEEGERARTILQAAAARPENVYNTGIPGTGGTPGITFTDLFEMGVPTGPNADASLRVRLAERTGDTSIGGITAATYLQTVGLTEAAFQEARVYMRNEARAFGSAMVETLPLLPVASTRTGTGLLTPATVSSPVYVSTSAPPGPPPFGLLAVRTRFAGTLTAPTYPTINDGVATAPSPAPITPSFASRSTAHSLDYATSVAYQVNRGSGLSVGAQNALALFLGGALERRTGRLEVCVNRPSSNTRYRIRVYGEAVANQYDIVSSVAGLRCAVEGTVQGAPCNLNDYRGGSGGAFATGLTAAAPFTITDANSGFVNFTQLGNEMTSGGDILQSALTSASAPKLNQMLFVVRRKNVASTVAGNYTPVGSFLAFDLSSTTTPFAYCTVTPLIADMEELVRSALEPSTEHCARAEQTCAGPAFSERIPLEDELVDDSDSYETSFRSALRRASDRAATADLLGEQLLEAGLELERRIETATENLESSCGGPLNVADLYFGSGAGGRGASCSVEGSSAAPCDSTLGQVCRGATGANTGVCTVDPTLRLQAEAGRSDSARRLLSCIGDSSNISYVSLGTRDLCVWVKDGRVCENVPGYTCPFYKNPAFACSAQIPAGFPPMGYSGYTFENVTEHLRMFESPVEDPRPNVPPPCDQLRELRQTTLAGEAREEALRKLVESGFFTPANLNRIAQGVGFEARPDDFAAVTYGGASLFSTGNPFTMSPTSPASAGWPCTSAAYGLMPDVAACPTMPPDPEMTTSLFCARTAAANCGSVPGAGRVQRAQINHRLGQAVLALRMIGGVGVGPLFTGPYLPNPGYLDYIADAGEAGDHEIADHYLDWTQGQPSVPFHDSMRPVIRANGLDYIVFEYDDDSPNDSGRLSVGGAAACFTTAHDPTIWTAFLNGLGGSGTPYTFRCSNPPTIGSHPSFDEDGDPTTSTNEWALVFKRYESLLGDRPGEVTNALLEGLGAGAVPDNPFDTAAFEFRGMLYWLLKEPQVNPDAAVLPSDAAPVTDMTYYWRNDRTGDPGNTDVRIARSGLTVRALLDGLELACEVERREERRVDCTTLPPPRPESLRDIAMAQSYLQCIGDTMTQRAETEVLSDLPRAVLDARIDSFRLEGARGAAAADVSVQLNSLNGMKRALATEISTFGAEIGRLRRAAVEHDLQMDLVDIEVASQTADRAAACASAAVGSISLKGFAGGGVAEAAITCANSLTQISFAFARADINRELLDLEQEEVWDAFRQNFEERAARMQSLASDMQDTMVQIRGALARMETERQAALRNLGNALLLDTDTAGRSYGVNTVMRRRYNTLLIRYQRAREDAVAAAWLARRAVEQKLALNLSDMHEDMSLVEAPSQWVDDLCTFTGIDYTRIRSANPMTAVENDNFADAYIGDYVRRLENVVESYRLDYPFHDAQDTAVISIRDDVANARSMCETEVPNLLAWSSNLDAITDPETHATPIWRITPACPIVDFPTASPCVSVLASGKSIADGFALTPFTSLDGEVGDILPFEVIYPSSFGGRIVQDVPLAAGTYRLSWYGKALGVGDTADAILPRTSAGVVITDRSSVQAEGPYERATMGMTGGTGWRRYWLLFRIDMEQTVQVAVSPLSASSHSYLLAAPMLEDMSSLLLGSPSLSTVVASLPPSEYVATTHAGVGMLPSCEDTDGRNFRPMWTTGCQQLCPAGFGTCAEGEVHCYHEIPLDLSISGIEEGRQLSHGGFAYGNYNYRVDSIAVNFVGRNLRDCSTSRFPSTCYSSGYLPYTLIHMGPYQVRNHRGEIYESPLFEGRIEHGRGLATERYLSNPLSSGDRAELADFSHRELRGRPLTGHYVLRVWDSDGFVFNNLEDVQVLLNYRYWTRFE